MRPLSVDKTGSNLCIHLNLQGRPIERLQVSISVTLFAHANHLYKKLLRVNPDLNSDVLLPLQGLANAQTCINLVFPQCSLFELTIPRFGML